MKRLCESVLYAVTGVYCAGLLVISLVQIWMKSRVLSYVCDGLTIVSLVALIAASIWLWFDPFKARKVAMFFAALASLLGIALNAAVLVPGVLSDWHLANILRSAGRVDAATRSWIGERELLLCRGVIQDLYLPLLFSIFSFLIAFRLRHQDPRTLME
jgi:hypothetical protein